MPINMTFSSKGSSLLKNIEALSLLPYDDQKGIKSAPLRTWNKGATIGYGYLISAAEWPKFKGGITQQQADALYDLKIKPYVNQVNTSINVVLTQNQFDALVILCYNIGTARFAGSSVVRKINANIKDPSIETSWKSWNKSQKVVNKGLINRRAAEWNIFNKAIYANW